MTFAIVTGAALYTEFALPMARALRAKLRAQGAPILIEKCLKVLRKCYAKAERSENCQLTMPLG